MAAFRDRVADRVGDATQDVVADGVAVVVVDRLEQVDIHQQQAGGRARRKQGAGLFLPVPAAEQAGQ